MRPYLAVVIDSFREAFASRVMPLLLVLFTIALLMIAPLGLEGQTRGELETEDILDARAFVARLRAASGREEPSPGRLIWQRMPDEARREIEAEAPRWPARQTALVKLTLELNRQLKDPAFHDPPAFAGVRLSDAARAALKSPPQNEPQTVRRNRLLLDAAFPGEIVPLQQELVRITYFGFDPLAFLGETSFPKREVQTILKRVLALLCSYFLGKFGVSVAILVSANIIPRMFEPGSIDLLFSKPVSRSLLFLTKFFSGCAFILVNVSYFLVGLWIILGLRFGMWSSQLLLAIPVFLFVFSIVYSLSAAAGVKWRNPIVSVIVALSVWVGCMAVGVVKGSLDHHRNASRIAVIVPAGDELFVSDKSGGTFLWSGDADGGRWVETFHGAKEPWMQAGLFRPLLGPTYDAATGQLLAVELAKEGQGMQGAPGSVVRAAADSRWTRARGPAAPPRTTSLFVDRGTLLAVGPAGAYRATLARPPDGATSQLQKVAPQEASGWFTPFAAGWDPDGRELAIYDRGTIRLYSTAETGALSQRAERGLESTPAALVGVGGDTVLVARADGSILSLDRASLATKDEFRPFGRREPRHITVSPDGRWFAVVFHHQRLWLLDARNGKPAKLAVRGDGDVSAAAFDAEGRLLVADHVQRVSRYVLEPFTLDREWAPPPTFEDQLYAYAVVPLYTLLPKPGDLDYLVDYLFTDKLSEATFGNEDNLEVERNPLDVWGPVWNNLAFLAVILGLTCVYVARRDF